MQVFKKFGHCKKCENYTLRMPYLQEKSKIGKSFGIDTDHNSSQSFFIRINNVFEFLRGHLHFSWHFFFSFYVSVFWMTV